MMEGRIYSVGYEGFEIGPFVERLVSARVTTLVDVRLNAVSRRRGFSKKALTAALEAVGIEYCHEPSLGNPQDNRDSFREGDGEQGRERMRAILENGAGDALDRLIHRAQGSRVAVLCVERDRSRCHRQVITDVIAERVPAIDILNIV